MTRPARLVRVLTDSAIDELLDSAREFRSSLKTEVFSTWDASASAADDAAGDPPTTATEDTSADAADELQLPSPTLA